MSEVSAALVSRVLALACRAPSAQNTQPWRWRTTGGSTLELFTDPARQLPLSDPDGRNVAMSCGAALHHAVTAAGALGLATQVDLAPPTSPKVADIRLTTGQVPPDSRTTLSSLQE
ncbi:MAG: putative nitroreductase, partial [Marmoricola sp.]|nr:putative nitroreductase [Marmoricola sp.]